MSQTSEQKEIIEYVKHNDGLVLVDSIAGSGKTYILKQIAKTVNPAKGLYIAYSKAIATEASKEFPKGAVKCLTTHSLAYSNTVKPLKLTLGLFNYKSITEHVPYEIKQDIVDSLREFCLSAYSDFDKFAVDKKLTKITAAAVKRYIHAMADGEIPCTHDFYLKLFHMLLDAGEVVFEPFDLLMLDEAGDLNEVTLEIFKLLPARKKVAVGDKHQNIFVFNHTINAFRLLEGQGKEFRLTQSFRVDKSIATRVEKFCRKYLEATMSFKGVDCIDKSIITRGFITRTNSALIDKIIELNTSNTPYTLIRKTSEIFKVPLMVCGFKYQGKIYDKEYKHIQNDIDDWYEQPELQKQYRSIHGYLLHLYEHDVALATAIKVVIAKGPKAIIDASTKAKSHENTKSNFILATAHSCKGLEFDEAIIGEDLNSTVEKILHRTGFSAETLLPEDIEALNLYYVACTRGKKVLTNARYL